MKQLLSGICLVIISQLAVNAQSTYVPLTTDEYRLIDRLEGMMGENNPIFMTSLKPYSSLDAYQVVSEFDESMRLLMLTNMPPRDVYNIKRFMDLNGEWGKGNYTYADATPRRDHAFLRYFYQTAQHMLLFSDDDYYVSINPVLHLQGALDEYSEDLGFINRRGVEVKARLFNKIGIYTTVSDNQERVPKWINPVGQSWKAYPGYSDFTKKDATAPYDAFYARGYIDIPIVQNNVQLTFGFDKNVIGDGLRSMILSDLAGPYTFVRMRYNFGGFFYQNLFMELMSDYKGALDLNRPKKYAAIHYLGYKISPRVEMAIVETNNYDMKTIQAGLFMPVILARTGQRIVDKDAVLFRNSLAWTTKVNWAKDVMSYSQINIQNFDVDGIEPSKNQFAYQLGLKYYNVATVRNLDLQVEWNGATPFMYSSSSVNTNFTHYNQPLAHHMESGFSEYIGRLTYQPIDRLVLDAKYIYTQGSSYLGQGLNNGSNIFLPYHTRQNDIQYLWQGDGSFKSHHMALNASYEFFPNMFADAGLHYINSSSKIDNKPFTRSLFYAGVRINALKRMYDWNQ